MSHQPLRCAACSRRIRANHPHIGIEDYESGSEVCYHARSECQERAAEDMHAMMERGKVYFINHYHVCEDADSGWNCSGGCFSGGLVVGRN